LFSKLPWRRNLNRGICHTPFFDQLFFTRLFSNFYPFKSHFYLFVLRHFTVVFPFFHSLLKTEKSRRFRRDFGREFILKYLIWFRRDSFKFFIYLFISFYPFIFSLFYLKVFIYFILLFIIFILLFTFFFLYFRFYLFIIILSKIFVFCPHVCPRLVQVFLLSLLHQGQFGHFFMYQRNPRMSVYK